MGRPGRRTHNPDFANSTRWDPGVASSERTDGGQCLLRRKEGEVPTLRRQLNAQGETMSLRPSPRERASARTKVRMLATHYSLLGWEQENENEYEKENEGWSVEPQ